MRLAEDLAAPPRGIAERWDIDPSNRAPWSVSPIEAAMDALESLEGPLPSRITVHGFARVTIPESYRRAFLNETKWILDWAMDHLNDDFRGWEDDDHDAPKPSAKVAAALRGAFNQILDEYRPSTFEANGETQTFDSRDVLAAFPERRAAWFEEDLEFSDEHLGKLVEPEA